MIQIIDYGAGNLFSVKKAFDYLDISAEIIASPRKFHRGEPLVLPGVGAFGSAVQKLHTLGFWPVIGEHLNKNHPFMGICLGMQLLLDGSEEAGGISGFGVVQGICRRFRQGKTPHIGWNRISIVKRSPVLDGIQDGSFFYFIHGYHVSTGKSDTVVAETRYFCGYPSVLQKGNIVGVQFHPEKSGKIGLKLLKNWVDTC